MSKKSYTFYIASMLRKLAKTSRAYNIYWYTGKGWWSSKCFCRLSGTWLTHTVWIVHTIEEHYHWPLTILLILFYSISMPWITDMTCISILACCLAVNALNSNAKRKIVVCRFTFSFCKLLVFFYLPKIRCINEFRQNIR